MTFLQALLLGIIQGITEFLPISSSGHLVIFQQLFGLKGDYVVFDVILHVATLGAIIVFFFPDLRKLTRSEALTIIIGTIPAAIVGLFFKENIESLFQSTQLVGFALMVTGILNFITDRQLNKSTLDHPTTVVSPKQGLLIGVIQALAITPGISRSGSTVAAGTTLGLTRQKAFQFSFLLGIPAIAGAGVIQLKELISQGMPADVLVPQSVVGAIAAFVMGLLSLYLFRLVMEKAKFELFGYYCLVVGVLTILFL